jgi:hypothetical protein
MATGDKIRDEARTEKNKSYFYDTLKLVGVVAFVTSGNSGSVDEGPLVDGKPGQLTRPKPGIDTGTIQFTEKDWEEQFQSALRLAGLEGPEQLPPAVFQEIIEDYVDGGLIGGGKARRKTKAVNPLASTTYLGWRMSNPKHGTDGTVTCNWRGVVSTG